MMNATYLGRSLCGSVLPVMVSVLCAGCSDQHGASTGRSFPSSREVHRKTLPPVILDRRKPEGFRARHLFEVRNTTSQTWHLRPRFVSCGCLDTTLQTTSVAPNEVARLEVAFDLGYVRKTRSETVVLRTGVSVPSELSFTLTVDSYPSISVLPYGSRVNRTIGRKEQFSERWNIVVYSRADETTEIRHGSALFASSSPGIKVEITPLKQASRDAQVAKGIIRREFVASVLIRNPFDEDDTHHSYHGWIRWEAGGTTHQTDVELNAASRFSVRPSVVFFSQGTSRPQAASVTISAASPFRITRVDGLPAWLEAKPVPRSRWDDQNRMHGLQLIPLGRRNALSTDKDAEPQEEATRHVLRVYTDIADEEPAMITIWNLE